MISPLKFGRSWRFLSTRLTSTPKRHTKSKTCTLLFMPHTESSRPFNSRGCTQPKYSPLPASDDTSTMSLKNKLIALKSRSTDQATRIDSPPNINIEEDVVVDDGTVYRVYKKRWIGVAIIMLLNIVSSWRYVLVEGCVRLTW